MAFTMHADQEDQCWYCNPYDNNLKAYAEGMLYPVCWRHRSKPKKYALGLLPLGDEKSWKRGIWV